MKNINLKIKNYANNIDIVNNNNMQRNFLNIILSSIGILAFFYVILLGSMVFNIVARKTLELEARSIGNEVGALELEYLTLSNNVNLEVAQGMGFQEVKNKKFTTRQTFGSLKLAKNEL